MKKLVIMLLMVCLVAMVAVPAVAAAGDCDQTQQQLHLMDGSGDDCTAVPNLYLGPGPHNIL